VLGGDGNFYGATANGGPGGDGTIFRLVISASTSVARQSIGSLLLTGTRPADAAYRLWATTNLSLQFVFWTLLTNDFFQTDGNFSYKERRCGNEPLLPARRPKWQ